MAWRFRSASSLTGTPAVNAAGFVFVASVEGFLHALAPDGTYRWSYGLSGMPIGAPAVDPGGDVYVATSARRLYAFKPDGRLHWTQTVAARFASPPSWAEPGLVYYAGGDGNLYSVHAWGSAPQPHRLGRSANGALAILADGAVAVGVDGPEVQLFRRASPLLRLELQAAIEQPLLGGKLHWFALTRAGLAAHDVSSRALVWTTPARRAGLSADERALVVEVDAALLWLEPASGRELHRVQLPAQASAAPVLTAAGTALVPLEDGRLFVCEPERGRQASVVLAPSPAWAPAWNEARQHVIAAAGGDVLGIDLSGWASAPPADASDEEEAPALEPRGDERRPPLGARVVERLPARGGA